MELLLMKKKRLLDVSGLGQFGLFTFDDLNRFDWLTKPNDLIGH